MGKENKNAQENPSLVFGTVVDKNFENYLPIYVESILRLYPRAIIKVLLVGKVKTYREDRVMYYDVGFSPKAGQVSFCSCLRFLFDFSENNSFVFISDVDMVFTSDFYYFFKQNMFKDIACVRGARRLPVREGIHRWEGVFKRITGGYVLVTNGWYQKTKKVRERFFSLLQENKSDNYDNFPVASYREYDEVLLARIMNKVKEPIPIKRNCFVNGVELPVDLMQIHLGDFKFPERIENKKKMKKRLSRKSIEYFVDNIDFFEWIYDGYSEPETFIKIKEWLNV